jgi:hypothetical protein
LSYVAGWNNKGLHLKLLKELLALGYDCSADTFMHARVPCSDFGLPDISYVFPPLRRADFGGYTARDREPFLLNFLAQCSKNAYGEF